jgi:predicted metal-binding membrane protein
MRDGLLAALLRNDRAIVWSGLVAVTLVAWAYVLLGAGMDMTAPQAGGMAMPGMMAMAMPGWTLGYAAMVFVMWAVMMMAMMLPSAAPTVLLVARLAGQRGATGGLAAGAAGLFAAGYALVWVAFSLAATGVEWGFAQAGLLSPMMAATDRLLAAGVLIAVGFYQWTPFKDACLRNCRSPLAVLLNHWRPGRLGALQNGLRNGLYCLGCCWALMALLFVGGVMNIAWIAGITLLVLIEKTLPWGGWTARLAGAALVLWGGLSLWPML